MEMIATSPKILGAALKRKRKQLGLTQEAAGELFRLQQSTVSSLEQGADGSRLDTLFRLLAALNLEIVIRDRGNNNENDGEW